MRFAVVNLGCKVNRVESDAATALLLSRGGVVAPADDCELIVVNTCTVTGEAEKKTRKAVHRALRENERARVVVTGCAAAIDPASFEAMDERVAVVAKGALESWLAAFAEETLCSDGHARACENSCDPVSDLRVGEGFPTRVGLKIQDGCENACTYCIVHVARGASWSRPADEIVEEAVRLARAGVKEIVLTGINLGSYRDGDSGLAALLRRLLDETAQPACGPAADEGEIAAAASLGEQLVRFRVSSMEPLDVDDDFIALLASAHGRICRHLHLPLQSGASTVLDRMHRPYDACTFEALVDKLRSSVAGLSLSTDIIVGFPGETDEEFAQTLALAERCRFSRIHVFPYSRRAGTPAAEYPCQVPPETRNHRARVLREEAARMRREDRAARAGTSELALVESDDAAMTESYYDVTPPVGAKRGELVPITFDRLSVQ